MLNKEDARQIVLEIIGHLTKTSGYNYAILEKGIREYPSAWVFPFNSVEFVATRDQRKLVMGIGPIVVKRKTGEAIMGPPLRFNHFLEQYLAEDDAAPAVAP